MNQTAPNVEAIFFAALEIDEPEARFSYLDEACGDTELRRHVERLLALDAQASGFLESPASTPTLTVDPPRLPEGPGTAIGPYKLLEPIGEGGMGAVYLAVQTQPVRRKVALKVIKPGMDTRQVIARFEAERQALALMDHPNIARVLDAGATESGRPFFVMELVRGIPITEYCDREQLSIAGRLELFVLDCRAVQHAHQKGVIHRDLKPSNILVTVVDGAAVPKVIDFGVAKATGASLTERTIDTGFHQFVGTPLYMSPEQADLSGMDVDTRSDIYALGVLLYELLIGTTPFDQETFRQAAFDEMRRMLREEEPPTPSHRLSSLGDERRSSVSAGRHTDARRLGREVRGELDWIVMKALEKDRRRRYETANDFAADVMRHLTGRMVEACPPSAWYRCSKFTRRNRVALSTGALLALALIAGTTLSTWQALRATRAERESRRQSALARKAVDEMYTQFAEKMLVDHGPLDAVQREFLEKALAYYQEFSRERWAAPGRRRETAKASARVGKIHHLLGRFDQAMEAYLRASTLYEGLTREFPDRDEYRQGLAAGLREVGHQLTHLGRAREAKVSVQRAIENLEQRIADHPGVPEFRKELAGSYGTLGRVFEQTGRPSEAADNYQKARDHYAKLAADFPREPNYRDGLAGNELNLGNVLGSVGRSQEGEDAYQRAREIMEKLATEHPNQPEYRSSLSMILNNQGIRFRKPGKQQEAEALHRRAIALDEALVAEFPDRPRYRASLASSHLNFGDLLLAIGRSQEVENHYLQAQEAYQKLVTDLPAVPDYRNHLAQIHAYLGYLRYKTGNLEEVESLFRRSLEMCEKIAAEFPEHPTYRESLASLYSGFAWTMKEAGNPKEAERAFRRGIEIGEELVASDPDSPNYRFRAGCEQNDLSLLLASRGEVVEARRLLERGITHEQAALKVDPKHQGCRGLLVKLSASLSSLVFIDDPDLAVKLARDVLDLDPNHSVARITIGWWEYRRRNWKACIATLTKEVQPDVGDFALAMAYWRTGDTARARATFEVADRWLRGYETRWKSGMIPYPRTLRRLHDEAAALLKVDEPGPDRGTGVNPEPNVG